MEPPPPRKALRVLPSNLALPARLPHQKRPRPLTNSPPTTTTAEPRRLRLAQAERIWQPLDDFQGVQNKRGDRRKSLDPRSLYSARHKPSTHEQEGASQGKRDAASSGGLGKPQRFVVPSRRASLAGGKPKGLSAEGINTNFNIWEAKEQNSDPKAFRRRSMASLPFNSRDFLANREKGGQDHPPTILEDEEAQRAPEEAAVAGEQCQSPAGVEQQGTPTRAAATPKSATPNPTPSPSPSPSTPPRNAAEPQEALANSPPAPVLTLNFEGADDTETDIAREGMEEGTAVTAEQVDDSMCAPQQEEAAESAQDGTMPDVSTWSSADGACSGADSEAPRESAMSGGIGPKGSAAPGNDGRAAEEDEEEEEELGCLPPSNSPAALDRAHLANSALSVSNSSAKKAKRSSTASSSSHAAEGHCPPTPLAALPLSPIHQANSSSMSALSAFSQRQSHQHQLLPPEDGSSAAGHFHSQDRRAGDGDDEDMRSVASDDSVISGIVDDAHDELPEFDFPEDTDQQDMAEIPRSEEGEEEQPSFEQEAEQIVYGIAGSPSRTPSRVRLHKDIMAMFENASIGGEDDDAEAAEEGSHAASDRAPPGAARKKGAGLGDNKGKKKKKVTKSKTPNLATSKRSRARVAHKEPSAVRPGSQAAAPQAPASVEWLGDVHALKSPHGFLRQAISALHRAVREKEEALSYATTEVHAYAESASEARRECWESLQLGNEDVYAARREAKATKEELAAKAQELSAALRHSEDLSSQLQEARAEAAAVRSVLAVKEAEKTKFKKSMESAQAEIGNMTNVIVEGQMKIAELEAQVKELKDTVARQQEELKAPRASDTSAALERERLRVKNAEEERDAAVLRACASEGNLKVANSLRKSLEEQLGNMCGLCEELEAAWDAMMEARHSEAESKTEDRIGAVTYKRSAVVHAALRKQFALEQQLSALRVLNAEKEEYLKLYRKRADEKIAALKTDLEEVETLASKKDEALQGIVSAVKECNSGSSSLSGSEIMERLREVLITAQNALEGQSDEAEDDDM